SDLVADIQAAMNVALTNLHAGSSSTVTITVGQSSGKITLIASAAGLTIQGDSNINALKAAITATYTFNQMFDVPDGILQAVEDQYKLTPNSLPSLKTATDTKYIDS